MLLYLEEALRLCQDWTQIEGLLFLAITGRYLTKQETFMEEGPKHIHIDPTGI